MLYVCVQRFDVTGDRGNILGWDGEVNKALLVVYPGLHTVARLCVHQRPVDDRGPRHVGPKQHAWETNSSRAGASFSSSE
jgi:hypothetical protein